MERKVYLFIAFVFLYIFSAGQSNLSIYRAFVSGDMENWKKTVDSLEAVREKTNKEKLDLINYQYGYIAWNIDKNKNEEARKYIKKAEELIRQLEQKNYNLSVLYAYKAAFIGFEIGISPYKAPFIGAESLSFAEKSVTEDTLNAFGYIQLGNIEYYKPAMFGGSKEDAVKYYLKALKLMESNRSTYVNNWNYLNLLATIIKVCIELEYYEMARLYSVRALKFEPDFNWIRNILFQQALKGKKYE